MILDSSSGCLRTLYWSQVLSRWWRCSWSSADRRCSNYIWVINNFIANLGASYIRGLTVNPNRETETHHITPYGVSMPLWVKYQTVWRRHICLCSQRPLYTLNVNTASCLFKAFSLYGFMLSFNQSLSPFFLKGGCPHRLSRPSPQLPQKD